MHASARRILEQMTTSENLAHGDHIYDCGHLKRTQRLSLLLLVAASISLPCAPTAWGHGQQSMASLANQTNSPALTTNVADKNSSSLICQSLVGDSPMSPYYGTESRKNAASKKASKAESKSESKSEISLPAESVEAPKVEAPVLRGIESGTTPASASSSATPSSSESPAPAAAKTTSSTGDEPALHGRLVQDIDSPSSILADLVKQSVQHDATTSALQGDSQKYSKGSQKLLQKSKDVANFVSAYKGFERSSEAADIILNEKVKVKSKASAAYAYQRKIDEYNSRIFSALMQMSTGLGMTDTDRKQHVIDSALAELTPYIGEDGAKAALERMKVWADSLSTESIDFAAKPLDVLETEQKVKTAVNGALQNDDVVAEIKGRLHKFNGRSKLMRGTAKVVNTTLSIAMLTPNFVSPAAQVAYLAFCISTGGPEDAKLLQELYLDQRFQSRWKVYNHKAEQAANSYNLSLLSKNPVALKFSQAVLNDMESGKPGTVVADAEPENKKKAATTAVKTDKTKEASSNNSASKETAAL